MQMTLARHTAASVGNALWRHAEGEPRDKEREQRLYAIIDASRNPMVIPSTVQALARDSSCLYQDAALEEFGDDTAWVAELTPDQSLLDWILRRGFGRRWAIFVSSSRSLKDIVRHLRKFTIVEDDESVQQFFRFYDPQVLRQTLPVLSAEHLSFFFREIDAVYLEDRADPDAGLLRLAFDGNGLSSQNLDI